MSVSAYSEMSYYKAMALKELGAHKEAKNILNEIEKFAKKKLNQEAQIDYFATSLPLLLVFEDDIQKRNTIDAKYLLFLASLGKENFANLESLSEEILKLNAMHIGVKEFVEELSIGNKNSIV